MSCYSSNTICTYEGRIVDTNKVLNSLALKMPLGYFGNITIAITVSDEEFMVRDEVDLVVSLPEVGPILNVPNRIELLEDSALY